MHSPVVLGLDFGGSKIAVAVADVAGARLGTDTVPIRPDESAHANFVSGVSAARELLAAVAGGRVPAAVGACTFGIPHEDRVALAPNVPGWEQLAFGRELAAAVPGGPVRTGTAG